MCALHLLRAAARCICRLPVSPWTNPLLNLTCVFCTVLIVAVVQLDVEQHQQQQHNHDPELAAPGRRGQPLLPLPSTAARGRHQPQQQQNDVCRPLVTERFTVGIVCL